MKNLLGELYLGKKIRNTKWFGDTEAYLEMRGSTIYYVSDMHPMGKQAMGEMNRPDGEWYIVNPRPPKAMTVADIEEALGYPIKVVK